MSDLLDAQLIGLETRFQHPSSIGAEAVEHFAGGDWLSSGLRSFDVAAMGVPKSALTLIAGESGSGVTSLALTLARNLCRSDSTHLLFLSTEYSAGVHGGYLLCGEAFISWDAYCNSMRMTDDQWAAVLNAAERISRRYFTFDDMRYQRMKDVVTRIEEWLDHDFEPGSDRVVVVDSLDLIARDDGTLPAGEALTVALRQLGKLVRGDDLALIVTHHLEAAESEEWCKVAESRSRPGGSDTSGSSVAGVGGFGEAPPGLMTSTDMTIVIRRPDSADPHADEGLGELIVSHNRLGPRVKYRPTPRIPVVFGDFAVAELVDA